MSFQGKDTLSNATYINSAGTTKTTTEEGINFCRARIRLKDPKPGKRYTYTISWRRGDCFDKLGADAAKADDYTFTHVEPGYIQIEGELEEEGSVIDSSIMEDSSTVESSEVESKAESSSKNESSKSDISVPDGGDNDSTRHQGENDSSKAENVGYWLLGDVNDDGEIDIEDAVIEMNHINGVTALDEYQTLRGDTVYSKTIDIEDVATIINHINGIRPINGKVKIPASYRK